MSEIESQRPVPLEPICDRAEFDELIDEMVAEDAPRMFAIVQERGDREDARVAAWGMAFDEYAALVSADGSLQLSLPSAERGALRYSGARMSPPGWCGSTRAPRNPRIQAVSLTSASRRASSAATRQPV